jgi:hypothetical protein
MTSEEIILNAYKTGHLTLEECLQLLRDINRGYVYPFYPTYPQITYQLDTVPTKEFTVTCTND